MRGISLVKHKGKSARVCIMRAYGRVTVCLHPL